MTRFLPTAIITCTAFFSFPACSAPTETNTAAIAGLDDKFERDTLIIESDDGTRHRLDIYLAVDFEQHRRGLMFVRSMPANTGMLFVYAEPDVHSMWMKNTYMSLDLVFARRAVPALSSSTKLTGSSEPRGVSDIGWVS